MKKKLYLFSTILFSAATLFLSSCLKDNSHYVNFGGGGTFVDFPLGGAVNFGADAITDAPASDANGSITRKFALNVASPNVPTVATVIKMSFDDPAIVNAYNAANPAIHYEVMPSNAYKTYLTTVTVPSGQQYTLDSITFYKNLLDPSKSYMLPVQITSTSNGKISGNLSIHYFHFIGNDFAGPYTQDFERYNAVDDSTSVAKNGASFFHQPTTFFPVSPTEFTVKSGYAGYLVSYDVTFTKNADGTYTNFAVQILPSDIAVLTANSITLQKNAVFVPALPSKQPNYTFAQAIKLFNFQWIARTSADRYLVDHFGR